MLFGSIFTGPRAAKLLTHPHFELNALLLNMRRHKRLASLATIERRPAFVQFPQVSLVSAAHSARRICLHRRDISRILRQTSAACGRDQEHRSPRGPTRAVTLSREFAFV